MPITSFSHEYAEMDDHLMTDIREMVDKEDGTCISIIVPTHRIGSDRQGDHIEVEKAVLLAKNKISAQSPSLADKLLSLLGEMNYDHNREGIGLFVSSAISKFIRFPFPVTKKIVIDKFFDLHDLLYTENYCQSYHVLDLSGKEVQLFRGVMDHMEEITAADLPRQITEDYEYSKPTHSRTDAGYAHEKSFEKDKSILHQLRLKKVFQQVDKSLSKYLQSEATPLLLSGSDKNVSLFNSITTHNKQIVGSISENHGGPHTHDMAVAWLKMCAHINEKKSLLIHGIQDKIGDGRAVFGIQQTWKELLRGKQHMTLLVEKNYTEQGFISAGDRLVLRHEEPDPNRPDVVNEIMTRILQKNGKVVVVENDMLKDYKRMALLLH